MDKKNKPSIVRKKIMPALLVLLALGMGYADLHAQENPSTPLNFSRAIDSAMKNNVELRNAQLQAQQYKALRGTAVTLNPTQVTLEEGNINSALNDDKWTVSQSFAFPLVYTSKAKSLRVEWERYELLASKKRAEIIRDVSSAYYDILVIRARLDVLQRADSILNFLFKQVSLREAQGDVDLLEKSSIHIQQLSLAQQFHTAQVELHAAERKLQQLLGTKQFYPLETSPLKATLDEGWYTGISPSSTSAQIIEQTTKQTKANLNMEWSQLLPSFLVGYTNQTFTGMGSDERYYSRSSRFNAFQVGVEIPIFFNSQAAKIKSARIQHTIAQLDKAYNHQRLEVEFKNTWEAYQNHLSFLSSYEAHSIDDAKKMWDIALRQYVQGMITYRDLMLHINQALDAQIAYLNTIKKYNETIFQLNYLAQ